MKGVIFDIKEMAVHDGPGLRTTVFLKGCPLRCRWCHNPEGLSSRPQVFFREARCVRCGRCRVPCDHPECRELGRCLHLCPENCMEVTGQERDSAELAEELKRQGAVMGSFFGGFTFSGGEPLFQSDFLFDLAKHLSGFHLCLETSGHAPTEVFHEALAIFDYFIMDVKLADSGQHKKHTGADNRLILENLAALRASGKPHLIRTPLIPSITDTEENLSAIRTLIGDSPWETLPYNTVAGAKYTMLRMDYPMEEV